jgi:hypothetical protein
MPIFQLLTVIYHTSQTHKRLPQTGFIIIKIFTL